MCIQCTASCLCAEHSFAVCYRHCSWCLYVLWRCSNVQSQTHCWTESFRWMQSSWSTAFFVPPMMGLSGSRTSMLLAWYTPAPCTLIRIPVVQALTATCCTCFATELMFNVYWAAMAAMSPFTYNIIECSVQLLQQFHRHCCWPQQLAQPPSPASRVAKHFCFNSITWKSSIEQNWSLLHMFLMASNGIAVQATIGSLRV